MNNQEFTIKCTLKEGVSQKGNTYEYLSIKLTDNYEKRVFLDGAEKELLINKINSTKSPFSK